MSIRRSTKPSTKANETMKIELRMDSNGIPYLELVVQTEYGKKPFNEQGLERFISLARQKGLRIQNESSFDTSNDYASIRINE